MNRKTILKMLALVALATVGLQSPAHAQNDGAVSERLAVLESREAIREVIYAYGRALDSRNFVAFSELFEAEQGTWVGGLGSATGREAIFELMDQSIGHAEQPVQPRSHHVFTNIQILVDGETASATTKWIFVVPSDDNEPRWMYLGHYDDQFVRKDGNWYFLHREAFTDIPVQGSD